MRAVGSLLVGIAVAVVPLTATAADWWVDADADPDGDGSVAAPFQEVQDGLDAAQPGDTVRVLPGTYQPIQTVRDGAADSRITVQAETRGAVIVQADGTAARFEHSHHTVHGLVFDGAYGAGDLIRAGGGDSLELVMIEARRSGADCVDLRTSSHVTIADSWIHHCVASESGVQSDAHGVTGDSNFDITIRNTEIGLVSGDSVQFSPPREPWSRLLIESCTLWSGPLDEAASGLSAGTIIGENAIDTKVGDMLDGAGQNPVLEVRDVTAYGWRGAIANQGAFNIKENVDAVIDRVTVYDSEIAFRLRAPSTVTVRNAVIYDVDKVFRLEDGLTNADLSHLTVGGDVGQVFEDAGGAPIGLVIRNSLFLGATIPSPADVDASNMADDGPAFVDPGTHDYHLVECSLPVDAGVDLPGVTQDRDGTARPRIMGWDVGAYEYVENPGGDDPTSSGDTDTGGPDTTSAGTSTAGVASDAGTTDTDASSGGVDGSGSGCGCRSPGGPAYWALLLVVAIRRKAYPGSAS